MSRKWKGVLYGLLMVLGMISYYSVDIVNAEAIIDEDGYYREYVDVSEYSGRSILINVQGGTIKAVNNYTQSAYRDDMGEWITLNHYHSHRRRSDDLEIIIESPTGNYSVDIGDASTVATPFDFTDVDIKDGNFIRIRASSIPGEHSYYTVNLEKGREYIFSSSNRTGFDLLDPKGDVVKSFSNREVMFEYTPTMSGTYTYRNNIFRTSDVVAIGVFELMDPKAAAEMDTLQIGGGFSNRIVNEQLEYFVKANTLTPFLYRLDLDVHQHTKVDFSVRDVRVLNETIGSYQTTNSAATSGRYNSDGMVDPELPFLFYAPSDTSYFWHRWKLWSGFDDKMTANTNVELFTSKTGDIAKDKVKELNAEDRKDSLVADPIDGFAGNFVDNRTLLSYGGSNPLMFELQYDSIANDSVSLRGGYVHNFETFVKETDKGLDVYWTPNSVVRFEQNGDDYSPIHDKQSDISAVKTDNGYEIIDGSQEIYNFDKSGKIIQYTNKVGQETDYIYTNELLSRVENSKGQFFEFDYDKSNRLLSVMDSSNRKVMFEYRDDRLDIVEMPNRKDLEIWYTSVPGNSDSYKVSSLSYDRTTLVKNTYDVQGRVNKQYDGNGALTTFEYDEYSRDDQVITTIHMGDRKEVLVHDLLGNLLSKTDAEGHVEFHKYDSHRNRVETIDKNGHEFVHTYDENNRRISTKNPNGTVVKYSYNEDNQLLSSTMADGETILNKYDVKGRLLQTIDRAGNVTTYTYDEYNNVSMLSREGYVVSYEYDDLGYVNSVSTNDGPSTQFENDVLGRVVKTIFPDGSFIENEYDVSNNVLSSTDQKGQVSFSTYNLFGDILSQTDYNGSTSTYTYDKNGNRLSSKTGDRETVMKYNAYNEIVESYDLVSRKAVNRQLISYNHRGEQTSIKDADGIITTWTYDGEGNVSTQSIGDSTQTYSYDEMGNNTSILDAYGNKKRYTYDAVGNVLSEVSSGESVSTFAYDKMGRIISSVDPAGNATTYEYDVRGNVIKITDANGAVTTYEYNDNNQQTAVVNALGERQEQRYNTMGQLIEIRNNREETLWLYEYDALGQVIKSIDGKGNISSYAYDANGNRVSITDALGNTIETVAYSMYNEAISVEDANNNIESMVYDNSGNMVAITNAMGESTSNHYTSSSRLSGVTDPLNTRLDYTYDSYGHLSAVVMDSDAIQEFIRDKNLNLIEESFGASALRYSYSSDQEMVERINARGSEITYDYDSNGRVIKETSPEGSVTYEYDAVGNILVVASNDSHIERTYDVMGRVVTKTQDGQTIGYEYDDIGNLTVMTYPNGSAVKYTYDVMGNLLTVTDWDGLVTAYVYDANNQIVVTKNTNGSEEFRTYDAKGQVLTLVNKSVNGVISSYSYEYDANGNIIQENDSMLQYDVLDRLIGSGDNSYIYSPLGNITSISGNIDQTMSYGNDNQLTAVNNVATTVDADGNLLKYTLGSIEHEGEYNSKNQLMSFDGVKYQYDGENNRIGLSEGDTQTSFVVDNDSNSLSQVLVESTGDESIYHVYGNGLIGSYVADGSFETNHYDYRGSVTGISDENGQVIGFVEYDEYGVILQKDESVNTRFLYNGKYGVQTDSNGLLQMRARYYNPSLKRFMNRDVLLGSVTETQTLNRYAYVNGNPISYHDPFGLARQMLKNAVPSMNTIHTTLDVVGMVPAFGMIPDAINTALYLATGDYTNAILSGMAIIPGPGDALTAGKLGIKHADDVAKIAVNSVDEVAEVAAKGYNGVKKSAEALPLSHFSKEVMKTKPAYSPVPKKWYDKGGKITEAGEDLWTYVDWDANSVNYRDGFPDFKEAGYVRQEVTLDGFSSSRAKDFRVADKLAGTPKSGTWHHHEDGVTMQDVDKTVHRIFKHIGGFSITNKK